MENQLKNIKKRQIWRSLLAYPAAAFVIIQAVDFFITNYQLNPNLLTFSLILLIGGFFTKMIFWSIRVLSNYPRV